MTLSPSIIRVGERATAGVVGIDAHGSVVATGAPTWTSSTSSVATVDGAGVVTAVAPGRSTVTASVGDKEGHIVVNVLDVTVAGVVLSADTLRLAAGETRSLSAALVDTRGDTIIGRTIIWSSDRPATATVSPMGTVSAVASGVSTIAATSGGATATATVIVSGEPGDPLYLELTSERASLVEGETVQLTATLFDVDGNEVDGKPVTWTATAAIGTGVATVSNAGLVTATSAGTVIVEATSGAARGSAAIVVRKDADESIVLTFGQPVTNATVGDSLNVFVSVQPSAPIVSVVATVGNKSLVLPKITVGAFGTQFAWAGILDLSDLQFGPYLLTVIATDATGAIGIAAITFKRDTKGAGGGSTPRPKNK